MQTTVHALNTGVSYYLEAVDAVGNVSRHPEPGADGPIGVAVLGTFLQQEAFPGQAWHLFSVPVAAPNLDLKLLLDEAIGQDDWVADLWNGSENVQADQPVAGLGKPFWLISTKPFQLQQVSGATTDPAMPQTFSLRRGWNLLANPYLFSVPFGNIRVVVGQERLPLDNPTAANFVRPRFWRWTDITPNDVTDGDYEMVANLSAIWKPWSGYWIFADADTTVQIEPFTELTQQSSSPVAPSTLDWLATLSISNTRGVSRVELSLAERARWDDDPLDVEQPPLPTQISLSLLREGARFQHLSLPARGDKWLWEADIHASENANLTLSDALPVGYYAYLEYLSDASRVKLSPNAPIRIADGEHRVRIRLTKHWLGWDVTDVIPTATRLLRNYPNPFNPETWIPFTLSDARTVEVAIYDTTGRDVRRLLLGFLPAGRYSDKARAAYWDGRNDTGELVASGVYFVELRAGQYRQVQPVVLLK